jgi:hypothetical protein
MRSTTVPAGSPAALAAALKALADNPAGAALKAARDEQASISVLVRALATEKITAIGGHEDSLRRSFGLPSVGEEAAGLLDRIVGKIVDEIVSAFAPPASVDAPPAEANPPPPAASSPADDGPPWEPAPPKRLAPHPGRALTEAEIEAGKTARGGFTRAQLEAWGVPYPPPKGWRKRLLQGLSIEPSRTCGAR